jgi:hypothetical protein
MGQETPESRRQARDRLNTDMKLPTRRDLRLSDGQMHSIVAVHSKFLPHLPTIYVDGVQQSP